MKKKTPKSPESEPNRSRETIMESQFTEDLRFWIETDRKLALRIMDLVKEILRDPFGGIGKPERLRYFQGNTWSRRINDEHRLVYVVENDRVRFKTARYHYEE